LRVLKLRTGSYFPGFLEPRCIAEKKYAGLMLSEMKQLEEEDSKLKRLVAD
jgi:hypothetical protein